MTGRKRWLSRFSLALNAALVALAAASVVDAGQAIQRAPVAGTLTESRRAFDQAAGLIAAADGQLGSPVLVRFDLLAEAVAAGGTLDLPLTNGVSVRAAVSWVASGDASQFFLAGPLVDGQQGEVSLTVIGDTLAGRIVANGRLFVVRRAPNSTLHVVTEIDPRSFPPETQPLTPPPPDAAAVFADQALPDTNQYVDLLVLYTPAARTAAGGTPAIVAELTGAINNANLALANAGVIHRFRLVYNAETDYTESGSGAGTDLTRLRTSGDGYLEDVFALRDLYKGDVVTLLHVQGGTCGVGYLMGPSSVAASFAPFAFNVVSWNCANANLSMAHEIGHNMGLQHDAANAGSPPAFSYAYGYRVAGLARDVMSYACGLQGLATCPRVAIFSTPGRTFPGTATVAGDAISADNARALDNTSLTVANFREGATCTYSLSSSSTAIGPAAGTGTVGVTASAGICAWTATSNASFITVTGGSSGTGNGSVTYSVTAFASGTRTGTITIAGQTFTVVQSSLPTLSLAPSTVNFGIVNNGGTLGFATPAQSLSLTQSGTGTVTWTAAANQSWITVSPASGSGPATISVSINNTGNVLPMTGSLSGIVTVTTTGGANSPTAAVNLMMFIGSQVAPPAGAFDTPANGQTGVAGSIAVTGWVIDDVGLSAVRILRDPVAGEGSQIFIGNAVFVRGARPDIAALNPTKPFYDRAGWGYLLLTNFLPSQGNGTFTLYAYADDLDGHTTLLGTKTITCTNATATAPFGALDTPAQGGTVSGSFVNFGWALAGQRTGRSIPTNGSTVQVYVDSALLGTVDSYNNARTDIQGLFPGYANTNGAIGVKTINSSTLANGVHTIFWIVTDNLGAAQGIGSRFFTVSNSSLFAASHVAPDAHVARRRAEAVRDDNAVIDTSALVAQDFSPAPSLRRAEALRYDRQVIDARSRVVASAAAVSQIPVSASAVAVTHGYEAGAVPQLATPDADGIRHVRTAQLERLVVALDPGQEAGATYRGYLIDGDTLRDLPVGSHLDARTGEFAWAPGLAFGGTHDLVFVRTPSVVAPSPVAQGGSSVAQGGSSVAQGFSPASASSIRVRVAIDAQPSSSGDPRLVIDIPGAGATLAQPFTLAGWALDPNGPANGSGIDTLHVWAYPVGGGDPRWVGVAAYGGLRTDVADLFGPRFAPSGYSIEVAGLPSGAYDLVVYAHSIASDSFTIARTVRVIVR